MVAIRFLIAMVLMLPLVARAQVAPMHDRPVRILAIGNSFSRNATFLLPKMIAAGGKDWVFKHADISGSTFERHMKSVAAYETDPASPAGRPYKIAGADDKVSQMSLKELLTLQPWDYVTVQQASIKSFDETSFEPSGLQLVAYVQKYAPQAKLIVHETWAYRPDALEFSSIGGLDQEQMYTRLHRNYADFAKKINAAGVIPTGTAFQNVREDSRWKPSVDTKVDLSPYKNNALPPEDHDLNTGWTWAREGGPWRIVPDRHHATMIGKYLAACVWYEFFIGDVRGNSYRPPNLSEEDALLMQDIAHKTVVDRLIPKAASVPVRPLTYPKPATRPTTVPVN